MVPGLRKSMLNNLFGSEDVVIGPVAKLLSRVAVYVNYLGHQGESMQSSSVEGFDEAKAI
jgi:hypothetical protein